MHFMLTQNHAGPAREGADGVKRIVGVLFRCAFQAFAIDRNDARTLPSRCPRGEKRLKNLAVQDAEHAPDRLRRSYPVLETKKTAQPIPLRFRKKNAFIHIIHATQLPDKQNKQNLRQRIRHHRPKSRIRNVLHPFRKNRARNIFENLRHRQKLARLQEFRSNPSSLINR